MEQYCVVKCEVANDVVVDAAILHDTTTDSRSDAEAAAEAAAKAHQQFGYDAEGGFWWGHNTGANTNRFTASELVEAQRLIEHLNA